MSNEDIKWDPIPSIAPQRQSEDIQWDTVPKIEVSGTAADLEPYKPAGVFSTRGKPAAKFADIAKGIMAKQREERAAVERYEKENAVPFQDLYSKPENLAIIKDYMSARFGKAGVQKEGESNEDYAKRFATEMRKVEYNTTLNAVPELNWIANAKPQDAEKAGKALDLWDRVPFAISKGGQEGVRPYAETAMSIASDPLTYVGLGIGSFGKYAAARGVLKKAFGSKVRTGVTAAAVEAPISAGSNIVQQRMRIESGAKEGPVDIATAVSAGLLGSVFSGFEAAGMARKPATYKKDLEDRLAAQKTPQGNPATQQVTEAFDREMEDILKQFDIFEGRQTLDELSPPTELTQAQIRNDINRKAIDVAKYVMIADPTFRPKKGQLVSEAIRDLFMTSEKIDDITLEAAFKRANITSAEFAQASLASVSDGARLLQGVSSLARVLGRLSDLDPETDALIKQMYGRQEDVTSAMGMFGNAIKRLEKESKALVVSSIGTTVRNIYGSSGALTLDAASRLLEGTVYETGKVLQSAATGAYQRGDLTKGIVGVIKDAFGTMSYLKNAGMTAEVVDKLLADNPALQKQVFSALQETGDEKLSKAARIANTFNVAQDALFRKAVFTASVERQLRRVGIDMFDVMANDKTIPPDVLKNAGDEALKATFSYMPKPQRKGQVTLEAQAEGVANKFVSFFENLPGGSLLVTFPRFMTNAMAFQYKYSPFGAASGMSDILAAGKRALKDEEGANRLYREGLEKFSRGTVGTAALYAAYKYRMENQDTEWYNVQGEDGSTVDVRAIFPAGPWLAVGDLVAKMKLNKFEDAKVSEAMEAIAGMKMPAGSQKTILDSLPELMAGEGKEADKFKKAMGQILGDFAGRFIQPGQPFFAYFDLMDRESQLARDPNVITGEDIVSEAAMNRIKGKLPGLKEELPVAMRYLREEEPVRAGEFFNILSGFRVVPRVNDIEKEFSKLNMDPYRFFGSTGDKVYDRAVISESRRFVEPRLARLLDSDRYNKLEDREKKVALANTMADAMEPARAIVKGKMTRDDRERVDKMAYNALSQEKRLAINEMYKRDNNGKTIEDTKDYKAVYRYAPMLEALR
jgi:hypothetical protein